MLNRSLRVFFARTMAIRTVFTPPSPQVRLTTGGGFYRLTGCPNVWINVYLDKHGLGNTHNRDLLKKINDDDSSNIRKILELIEPEKFTELNPEQQKFIQGVFDNLASKPAHAGYILSILSHITKGSSETIEMARLNAFIYLRKEENKSYIPSLADKIKQGNVNITLQQLLDSLNKLRNEKIQQQFGLMASAIMQQPATADTYLHDVSGFSQQKSPGR